MVREVVEEVEEEVAVECNRWLDRMTHMLVAYRSLDMVLMELWYRKMKSDGSYENSQECKTRISVAVILHG